MQRVAPINRKSIYDESHVTMVKHVDLLNALLLMPFVAPTEVTQKSKVMQFETD